MKKAIAIFVLLCGVGFTLKRLFKKPPSPILMILLSAGLGVLLYGI